MSDGMAPRVRHIDLPTRDEWTPIGTVEDIRRMVSVGGGLRTNADIMNVIALCDSYAAALARVMQLEADQRAELLDL